MPTCAPRAPDRGALPNPTNLLRRRAPERRRRTISTPNSQQQATIEMPITGVRPARRTHGPPADRQIGRADSASALRREARRAAALGIARLMRAQNA